MSELDRMLFWFKLHTVHGLKSEDWLWFFHNDRIIDVRY